MNVEDLICAVKERPSIWYSKHPHYKFKKKSNQVWEEVQSKLPNYTMEQLKKKWKNLKDVFLKEWKKVIVRCGSTDPDPSEYTNWVHFKSMLFLREEYSSITLESFATINGYEIEETDCNSRVSPEELTPEHQPEPWPTLQLNGQLELASGSISTSKPRKRKLRHDIESQEIDQTHSSHEESTKADAKSDDFYFLMSILPEIEKLPIHQRLRLRNNINNCLLDEININMNNNLQSTDNVVQCKEELIL